ncbi:hypothetical protein BC834DRAFT_851330 [Gloeopeniophorella convolvens]|nr:hypothetical protein BC834DRAFT_851330 [Gloeopeniophorella convolvens]
MRSCSEWTYGVGSASPRSHFRHLVAMAETASNSKLAPFFHVCDGCVILLAIALHLGKGCSAAHSAFSPMSCPCQAALIAGHRSSRDVRRWQSSLPSRCIWFDRTRSRWEDKYNQMTRPHPGDPTRCGGHLYASQLCTSHCRASIRSIRIAVSCSFGHYEGHSINTPHETVPLGAV